MTMSVGIEMKSPFGKRTNDAEKAAKQTERELAKLPFGLQVRRAGDKDWRTIAKSDTPDALTGLVAVCDNSERRLLNRNTIVAAWAAGEKAGQR